MLKHVFAAAFVAAAGLAAAPAFADKPPVYTDVFSDVAVGGYDAVAYFTDHQPVAGSDKFTTKYMGAKYKFATQEHLDAFVKQPALYAPQFGGYCAWAVSQDHTAKGDPKVWRVVNGKLYLNYNTDVQKKWEQDIPGLVAKGEANWPAVLKK